ncbi:MAG TPA: ABC transporter permease [Candidatus Dormibacteraeota bacterium]|nr:ABC transporter permease [Candidatus Dormibacteraeota bacterium]
MTNLITLTRMRMRLAMRNKMFFFFSVVMPIGIFFLYAGVFAKSDPAGVKFLLGPALSFNVMGSFWGLSAALVMFREQGILRRFHVCPVKESDMLASSLLASCLMMLPIVVLELLFARYIFHVPSLGNVLSIVLLATAGIISFGSLGLVIASVTNTMQETQVLNQLLWLPLIFLSGATIPFTALSKGVQYVALFLPATYLVHGFKRAIMEALWPNALGMIFISLLVWFVLTLFLSTQLFRWEPEAKIGRKAKLYVLATAIPFFLLGLYEAKNGRVIAEEKIIMQKLDDSDKSKEKPGQQQKQEAPKPDQSAPAPESH